MIPATTTINSIDLEKVEKDRYASNGVKMPLYVILDMSICSFIDNDGVLLMKSILTNFSQLNIRLLLARCTGE